ncbi:pilus assembly protein [Alteriqipengyuania lutimaris]|nr:TadE/TadG family type IV pilus assembly protein [Alteriqipengyuania lutimaris]MBB3032840.1 Flp pilus assembly protein TadG [Alteriqipengyuania lutimaris]
MNFLTRLRRDTRGNTLAIAAAAMVPLIGIVGGAVDMSRIYIVKTRLQHACDAGALAGRKAMGSGQWSQANFAARDAAEKFFDANIAQDAYGAEDITRTFTESAGRVTGTATADLPMSLMRIFGIGESTPSVTCDAEMRLPNTDIMFVLDVTGSMNDPIPGESTRKIDALKTSVKCFYEIVARRDTTANCATGTPTGGTSSDVQIRFGFVPYNTNVNVGRLLPASYFKNSHNYQTRITTKEYGPWGAWSDTGFISCGQRNTWTEEYDYVGYAWWNGKCQYNKRERTAAKYTYDQFTVDVSGFKTGERDSATVKIGNSFTRTVDWPGCIEERQTVRSGNYWPIPAGAYDLQIDELPTDDARRWAPALPDLIYTRGSTSATRSQDFDRKQIKNTTAEYAQPSDNCPTEAVKLQEWDAASGFESYVDGLSTRGNTYHDIGLLWGARLLSANGIFKSENELTPKGGEIDRHLIFMTDGDTVANNYDYTAYGVGWYDQRTTTGNDYNHQVNARFDALCDEIKNLTPRGITLWVVSFGDGTNGVTKNRLEGCATGDTYYFHAADSAQLQQTFKRIADDISQLRLTR